MRDSESLALFTVNGEPVKPKRTELGHLLALSGIGAGIPIHEPEHLVQVGTFHDPDNWICVSYPGFAESIAEEMAPVTNEIIRLAQEPGSPEPFSDMEVAQKTPLLGLVMMSSVFSNTFELDMWVDLDL